MIHNIIYYKFGMDVFLKKDESDIPITNIAPSDTKKIEFKQIKEKKCIRTYILNIESYIKDEKELEKVMTNIKKLLGTSCVKKETNFGLGYGFNGDFSEKIKHYLISNNIVNKDAFK